MDDKAGRIPQKGDWTMKKLTISGFVWLAAIVILAPITAWGQTYAEADFSRRDGFTRDGLVACWNFLTPGVEGDMLQGAGDFESWTGTEGGCTNCPEGWICSCTGTSDANQETANIYKDDSAVVFTVDAANSAISISKDIIMDTDSFYQVTVKAKGTVATDDFYIGLQDQTNSEYYNGATDSWQVAFVRSVPFDNIPTDWATYAAYVKTDTGIASPRTIRLFIVRANSSQTFYIDDVKLQKLKHSAPVSDTDIALEMPVTSDPSFDTCRDCQSFRGQPGDFGTTFSDGKSYLSRADDNTFDPASHTGHFSVGCKGSTNTIAAGNAGIIAKDDGGANRGWNIIRNSAMAIFDVYGPGGVRATTVNPCFTVGTLHSILGTFRTIGNGDSIITTYCDEKARHQLATGFGPPTNVTINLDVGKYSTLEWDGSINQCCYWNSELSEIAANKFINPYFPGNSNGPGFYVDTCTQVASHATCSWDNCREGTPEACQAEGTGVMAVFGQFTGIQDNNSFGTNTNTQDNPTFTGFTYTENAGDGTANVSQYFGESKHGDSSLRIKLTGTTSYAFVGSTCNAMLPNTDYYAYVGAKCRDGKCPTNARVYVLEYSDASCIYNLVSNSGTMSNLVTSSWKDYGVQFTSAATTNFYKIGFEARNGNADVLFDNLDLKEASYHTPWVHVPSGGGAVTYNVRDYRLHNPLSDYIQSEGKYGYEDGFCIGGWVWTDWDGNDSVVHYFWNAVGTAGNNNRWWVNKAGSNVLTFYIYDNAGGTRYKALTPTLTNWSIGGWKYIEACSSNTGTLAARHYNMTNDTWYSWDITSTVGTGIQDGAFSEMRIGNYGAVQVLDGYFGPFKIGPYSAVWPMYVWDKRPTKKPY